METISTTTLFIFLGILLILSAFFSGTETSMMAINHNRLKALAKKGNKKAKLVTQLLEKIEELIGVILLGNNFVNILASAISTILAIRLWGDGSIAFASLLLTAVILIFAEVTPKTFAAKYPEKIALFSAKVIWLLIKILKPLLWVINLISKALLSLFHIDSHKESEHNLSREELKIAVNEAQGFVSSKYQKILLNIIDLEKETVDDIMIPRNELLGVNIQDEKDILEQIANTQHTRLLVFDGNENNIIGLIHMRNVVNLYAKNEFNIEALKQIIREPYFVLEGTKLSQQLVNFQREKRRIALVVDEYGDVQGMVVLEDILEEIVGNFTSNLNDNLEEIKQQIDGSYLIDAKINIKDLNRHLNINIPIKDAKTINGLILEYLENIPKKDTSLKIENYLFDIVQTSKYGVKVVKLQIK